MPYNPIVFNNQGPPGISADRLAYMQTQYDEAVEDIENADRTLDPSQTPAGNVGPLQAILNWFTNRIKAITGKTYWWEAPDTTLAAAKGHMDAAAPHTGHALSSDVAAHLADTMPHRFTDGGTTYRWGLAVIGGVVNMVYEEVV